jgi:hypothetical protein
MHEPYTVNPSPSSQSVFPDKGKQFEGIDFERAYTVLIRAYLRRHVTLKEHEQWKEVTDE